MNANIVHNFLILVGVFAVFFRGSGRAFFIVHIVQYVVPICHMYLHYNGVKK
jgi:hypothetical protein